MAKIVQAAMPVAGLGVHNYIVLVNDAGQNVGEIHGTAQNGQTFAGAMTGELYAGTNISLGTWATDNKSVMAQGSFEQMLNLFNAGREGAERINEKDLNYGVLASGDTYNSNSVFRAIAESMGLGEAIADMPGWEPGVDKSPLSWGEIQVIQDIFDVFGTDKDDDPFEDIWTDQKSVAPLPGTAAIDQPDVSIVGGTDAVVAYY